MIRIYLAETDRGPLAYILPYVISLGMLIRDSARLMPDREWAVETIGL